MIAQYNDTEARPGPSNLGLIVGKRLKLQGYIVSDYRARSAEFYADMRQWIAASQVKSQETVVEGISTNIALHRELMVDAKFIEGGTSIHYLEGWMNAHRR
mgnify:CR=1 FL=1